MSVEENDANGDLPEARQYEGLTLDQERAVVLLAAGESVAEVARRVRSDRNTVYAWMKSEAFVAARRVEEERAMQELRAALPALRSEAYEQIRNVFQDDDTSPSKKAEVALRYLAKSGFLIESETKEERENSVQEAVRALASVLAKHGD